MDSIRVLIADDHTLFRDGLRTLLTSISDIQVAGEAATGQETVAQTAALQPDVILMDVQMPDMNGTEATCQILRTSPHLGIIVLTMFRGNDSVFAAMRAGGRRSNGAAAGAARCGEPRIAENLIISMKTVRNHVSNNFRADRAREAGLDGSASIASNRGHLDDH